MSAFDQDAVVAAADLVARSGAGRLEIGYQDDDVPAGEPNWYAQAMFRGARIIYPEGTLAPGPVEAAEGLARRLLAGARCRRCGEPIRLDDEGEGCRWTRAGKRWEPGCGMPIDQSIPARR